MPKKQLAPIVIEESPLVPMTLEEAQSATNDIKGRIAQSAVTLYALRERKGYSVLGYADFQSYYTNALQMDKSTAYHWLTRVEATLAVQDKPVTEFLKGTFGGDLLPQESAGQLMKLPSDELRRVAWSEIEGIRSVGQRMENQYYTQLVKIVKRLTGQSETESEAMSDAVTEAPAVKQKTFKAPPSKAPLKTVHHEDDADDEPDMSDYDDQLAQEAQEPSTLEADTQEVTDTSVTVSATNATDIISETATDVHFDSGWMVVRYEEPGRVPISLKFDAVHMQSVIFEAAQFIRTTDN